MASFAPKDIVDAIQENDTSFNTRIADNTTNRLDVPGTYPFNIGRHLFVEDLNTDGGTFIGDIADTTALTDLPGKFQITASAGEEHVFGSRELLRYVPNYELLWGAAVWADAALSDGQHFAIELSDTNTDNGYRYHYEGTASGTTLTLEQYGGGSLVDSTAVDLAALRKQGFDPTKPTVARDFLNWYGAGESRYQLSFPITQSGDAAGQLNETVGRTANRDDVATDEINLRVQVRVWCEAGAADLTVNVCSMGALVRGNATEFDREKPAVHWDIGGSISQYPSDNAADTIAARIDPDRRQVVAKILPPKFAPGGSGVTMELTVSAVHKDHPDLTVNFDDPGDDGTAEGPAPAAQAREQTDVMQYTRDVTSFPTTTDVRADGTTGEVPDVRHITSTVADSGSPNSPSASSSGEGENLKRLIFPDDVVLFIPRTDPAGSTTNGRIQWLKPVTEQDW